jgi:flavin reductase (DIM6/NTAB) family NADH-FMN oxidoreductase RutF
MHLTREDLEATESIKRLNIVNSVTGIKPANLVGTIGANGIPNLAIFSSVVHLGSNPALLGFIVRPTDEVRRHTYENVRETGYYTINNVHNDFVQRAHYTSAKFEESESEFEQCQLSEEYIGDFPAPFVKESELKMGMKLVQQLPIEVNGTIMMIGSIEHLIVADRAVDEHGHMDLSAIDDSGISGLNSYYSLTKVDQYPYARPHELPDFFGNQADQKSSES